MNTILVKSIGKQAYGQLFSSCSFVVMGNTSKGVFLKGPTGGIIFLSYEIFRGPLTINIGSEAQGILSEIQPGSIVLYKSGEGITFPEKQIQIMVNEIDGWIPDNYSSHDDGIVHWSNLVLLQDWLRTNTPDGSFSYICSTISESTTSDCGSKSDFSFFLQNTYKSLRDCDSKKFFQASTSLIGLGSGLTPSGDDFLSGMGLAVSRYSQLIPDFKKYLPWFNGLIPIFYRKTTTLSAALYIASLSGTADERLIKAFDAILRKDVAKEDVIPQISTWGSSSGFDSISGFYILMKAIQP